MASTLIPNTQKKISSNVDDRIRLVGLGRNEILFHLENFGIEKQKLKMRTKQIFHWIYNYGVRDWSEMTNIAKKLRNELEEKFSLERPKIIEKQVSNDGTRKYLIQMSPGVEVETVFIPDVSKTGALCVSSQVGCTLTCKFCHTGTQKLVRNLTSQEIVLQVISARDDLNEWPTTQENRKLTNIVFMGMGEPLLNFDSVTPAIALMMDDNAYNLSKRRVTLSTAGVVPAIDRLSQITDVSLAISLHAPNDLLRNELVPVNQKYNIDALLDACNRYLENLTDKRVITMEYTMIDGVNDQPKHARELAQVLKRVPCKLNLIPFNPFPGSDYRRSPRPQIEAFQRIMAKSGIITTIRSTRGDDIDAACGQLVGQVKDRTRRSAAHAARIEAKQI